MAQAYATLDFLTSRIPELKCLTPADVSLALDDAESFIDITVYALKADWAHATYAAHLLTCRFPDELGGEQGPVTSLGANEISASFAVTASSEGSIGTTKWGRAYQQICDSTLAPYVVG